MRPSSDAVLSFVAGSKYAGQNERTLADISCSLTADHMDYLSNYSDSPSPHRVPPPKESVPGQENRRLKRAYRFWRNLLWRLGTKQENCSCSRARAFAALTFTRLGQRLRRMPRSSLTSVPPRASICRCLFRDISVEACPDPAAMPADYRRLRPVLDFPIPKR